MLHRSRYAAVSRDVALALMIVQSHGAHPLGVAWSLVASEHLPNRPFGLYPLVSPEKSVIGYDEQSDPRYRWNNEEKSDDGWQ